MDAETTRRLGLAVLDCLVSFFIDEQRNNENRIITTGQQEEANTAFSEVNMDNQCDEILLSSEDFGYTALVNDSTSDPQREAESSSSQSQMQTSIPDAEEEVKQKPMEMKEKTDSSSLLTSCRTAHISALENEEEYLHISIDPLVVIQELNNIQTGDASYLSVPTVFPAVKKLSQDFQDALFTEAEKGVKRAQMERVIADTLDHSSYTRQVIRDILVGDFGFPPTGVLVPDSAVKKRVMAAEAVRLLVRHFRILTVEQRQDKATQQKINKMKESLITSSNNCNSNSISSNGSKKNQSNKSISASAQCSSGNNQHSTNKEQIKKQKSMMKKFEEKLSPQYDPTDSEGDEECNKLDHNNSNDGDEDNDDNVDEEEVGSGEDGVVDEGEEEFYDTMQFDNNNDPQGVTNNDETAEKNIETWSDSNDDDDNDDDNDCNDVNNNVSDDNSDYNQVEREIAEWYQENLTHIKEQKRKKQGYCDKENGVEEEEDGEEEEEVDADDKVNSVQSSEMIKSTATSSDSVRNDTSAHTSQHHSVAALKSPPPPPPQLLPATSSNSSSFQSKEEKHIPSPSPVAVIATAAQQDEEEEYFQITIDPVVVIQELNDIQSGIVHNNYRRSSSSNSSVNVSPPRITTSFPAVKKLSQDFQDALFTEAEKGVKRAQMERVIADTLDHSSYTRQVIRDILVGDFGFPPTGVLVPDSAVKKRVMAAEAVRLLVRHFRILTVEKHDIKLRRVVHSNPPLAMQQEKKVSKKRTKTDIEKDEEGSGELSVSTNKKIARSDEAVANSELQQQSSSSSSPMSVSNHHVELNDFEIDPSVFDCFDEELQMENNESHKNKNKIFDHATKKSDAGIHHESHKSKQNTTSVQSSSTFPPPSRLTTVVSTATPNSNSLVFSSIYEINPLVVIQNLNEIQNQPTFPGTKQSEAFQEALYTEAAKGKFAEIERVMEETLRYASFTAQIIRNLLVIDYEFEPTGLLSIQSNSSSSASNSNTENKKEKREQSAVVAKKRLLVPHAMKLLVHYYKRLTFENAQQQEAGRSKSKNSHIGKI